MMSSYWGFGLFVLSAVIALLMAISSSPGSAIKMWWALCVLAAASMAALIWVGGPF